MRRAEVLAAVKPLEGELKRLGFGKLYLFGSVARDEPEPRDVDFLYEAKPEARPGFFQLTDALARLEEVLGSSVDLVDRQRLHQRIRPRVEAEMIEVYR
jgi:predicted nucleotidyltransferase